MTAEIVIMNREGVAMAADSMVTVGAEKVFDTATKLHMLAPGYSIGVMIFNSANFMDLPWEVVLKLYRNDLIGRKRRFVSVKECAEDFLNFLKGNSTTLSTQGQQKNLVGSMLDALLEEMSKALVVAFRAELARRGPTLTAPELEAIIESTINQFASQLDQFPYAHTGKDLVDFSKCFEAQFGPMRDELIARYFDQTPLTSAQRQRIATFCLDFFAKKGRPISLVE
jgi:hypothetical protein